MRGLGTSPFQSSLPPIFPSISLPQPLGSEAFKILSHVFLGLPFIPVGPDRDFGRVQRTIMRLSCPEPQDMDGWAHFFLIPPPTHNSCSGLFFILPCLTFTKGHALLVCPHFLLCFLISPRLYPFPPEPCPGQANAIGASSLRDPVPYLSLICLLFLTPPSVPLWTPGPKSQC